MGTFVGVLFVLFLTFSYLKVIGSTTKLENNIGMTESCLLLFKFQSWNVERFRPINKGGGANNSESELQQNKGEIRHREVTAKH